MFAVYTHPIDALAQTAKTIILLEDDDYPDNDLPYCGEAKDPNVHCRPNETAPVKRSWPFPWQTLDGSIFCRSYFAFKEAKAAICANDQSWLKETECFQVGFGMTVILIDAPTGRDTHIWRGRLSGENFYFDESSVGNYARSGPFKDRAEAEKVLLSLQARFDRDNPRLKGKFGHTFATDEQGKIHLLIGVRSYWLLNLFCKVEWTGEKPVHPCEVPSPLP